MRKYAAMAMLALVACVVCAHAEPPPYKTLRYDEDYTYLRDPSLRTDFFDPAKYIELDQHGFWYLSTGGEMRQRYEFFSNTNWGAGPLDHHGYSLQRYMLHADVHYKDVFRIFSQLKSGIELGRAGGPRPTDRDDLDLHQLFSDIKVSTADGGNFVSRIGRQELDYGSARLVSVREGPNVRRSFDAARGIYENGKQRYDIFFSKPVETKRYIFDDNPNPNSTFWGLYNVTPFCSGHNVDLYYLGVERHNATFNQGTGRELRHTAGTRLWGDFEAWDYNTELAYQFGSFSGGDISAWTAASDTGYTFTSANWRPRASFKANITSGDNNPDNTDLQTFNPLFPKGAYFSEAALIGPANHIDLHPSLGLNPTEDITFTVDWDFFWRQSTHDGVYGIAVNLERPADSSRARYVGSQPQAILAWKLSRHWTFFANYARFFAGPFLKNTGPGKDIDFVTTWLTLKF